MRYTSKYCMRKVLVGENFGEMNSYCKFDKVSLTKTLKWLIHLFARVQRVRYRGQGKSSCMLSKMLVLATINVHETSLANQHFYSTLLGRREGVCKKSTLCTLVKITDDP